MEDELRDVVLIEVVLYFVVVEYGSLVYKVYIFVWCFLRFYKYVFKNWSFERRVVIVKNIVFGFVLVIWVCGNDVLRFCIVFFVFMYLL